MLRKREKDMVGVWPEVNSLCRCKKPDSDLQPVNHTLVRLLPCAPVSASSPDFLADLTNSSAHSISILKKMSQLKSFDNQTLKPIISRKTVKTVAFWRTNVITLMLEHRT